MSSIGSSVWNSIVSSIGPAIWFLLIAFLVYAFSWVFSFIAWVVWFFWSVFYFPIELINQTIYPVWQIVYLIYTWLVAFVVVSFVLNLFKKNS